MLMKNTEGLISDSTYSSRPIMHLSDLANISDMCLSVH